MQLPWGRTFQRGKWGKQCGGGLLGMFKVNEEASVAREEKMRSEG